MVAVARPARQLGLTEPDLYWIQRHGIGRGKSVGTELRYYAVNGERRISVSSDPMLPEALAPAVKAIHGLHTVHARPLHHDGTVQSAEPEYTNSRGSHYIVPADFAKIYDVPANLTGAGVTIGIVGRSRVDLNDIANFQSKTGVTFAFTEVVPSNGIDPGAPQMTYNNGAYNEDQLEATLDVTRAGSVAPGANLLLVITTAEGGDIEADAQYLVNTEPVPAQVMSISFGLCEYTAGANGVDYWDSLFQQAATEGISVFVSSGDAGAAGAIPILPRRRRLRTSTAQTARITSAPPVTQLAWVGPSLTTPATPPCTGIHTAEALSARPSVTFPRADGTSQPQIHRHKWLLPAAA